MEITEALETILGARYGREVRQAIHDGIKQAYEDGTANGNANMEVSQARGSYPTLAERLTNLDKVDRDNLNELMVLLAGRIEKGQVTLADLTQEVREILNGDRPLPIVGKDSVIGYENIVDGTVTPDNLIAPAVYTDKGKNLFNKDTVINGYYCNYLNGQLIKLVGFSVSDYIQVEPLTEYIKNDKDGQQVAFFDANFNYLSGQEIGFSFTTPANAKYVRATVRTAYLDTFMIVKGNKLGNYEPYIIKLKRDGLNKLKPLELTQNEMVYTTKSQNLFDKTNITKGGYIFYETGKFITQSGYNHSGYIPVEPSTEYIKNDDGQQVAFFDANFNYLSGLAFAVNFTTPANAAFVVATIKDRYIDTFQLEKGSIKTPYASYGALKLDRTLIEDLEKSYVKPKLLIPSKITIIKGMQFDIYLDGVLKYYQEFSKGSYYVSVQTLNTDGTYTNLKGKLLNNKWYYKPTTLETFKLEFRVCKTYTDEVVDKRVVEFNVIDKPAGKTATIVSIGDSFTDGYGITKRISDLMDADGVNYNFIGLHDTGKEGVYDDAWSGYSYAWYVNSSSGYKRSDRQDEGTGATSNQFFNQTTGKFDFKYYMDTYQAGKTVDVVTINLGLNDVQTKSVTKVKQEMEKNRSNVQHIISSIQAYNPNIKILIGLIPKQNANNAYISTYSTTFNHFERLNHNVELFNEMLLEFDGQSNVTVMATNANFDKDSSYLGGQVATNQMTSDTEFLASDIHPNTVGAEYIARTVYQAISKFME